MQVGEWARECMCEVYMYMCIYVGVCVCVYICAWVCERESKCMHGNDKS